MTLLAVLSRRRTNNRKGLVATLTIDGALEDVFDLQDEQDEVTQRVVGAIEPSITQGEINRANVKSTSNLDAYDHYFKALSIHYSQTRADVDEAVRLLEEAIALDPSYS